MFPIEITKQIMAFAGIDYIRVGDEDFQFNPNNDLLYVTSTIKLYIPRQCAGFGMSVAHIYVLLPGKYKKKDIVYNLLKCGYFGEDEAKPINNGWKTSNCMTVKLKRKGYYYD